MRKAVSGDTRSHRAAERHPIILAYLHVGRQDRAHAKSAPVHGFNHYAACRPNLKRYYFNELDSVMNLISVWNGNVYLEQTVQFLTHVEIGFQEIENCYWGSVAPRINGIQRNFGNFEECQFTCPVILVRTLQCLIDEYIFYNIYIEFLASGSDWLSINQSLNIEQSCPNMLYSRPMHLWMEESRVITCVKSSRYGETSSQPRALSWQRTHAIGAPVHVYNR